MSERYISDKRVPPRGNVGADVLIISDFPTHEDEVLGYLLGGDAGKILEASLPVPISTCMVMSLSQYRPDNNDFAYLEESQALKNGLEAIKSYITQYNPKLIIILGASALRHIVQKYDIYKWRGSPLFYGSAKLLATHHPKEVIAMRTLYPIFAFDIDKAFRYLKNEERIYIDNFTITADPMEMMNYVEEIIAPSETKFITLDIENRRDNLDLLCVGFGLSATRAICFVCSSESSLNVLRTLLPRLKNVIYHNALWDVQVLRYKHGMEVPPAFGDTMLAQHVNEPELPKGLDFLCSVYTWRPCYWADISFNEKSKTWSDKASKRDSLYVYNCLDCVVTYEAYEAFIAENVIANPVYKFKVECLELSMHMGSTGFLVDTERRKLLFDSQKKKWEYDYITLCALIKRKINLASPAQVKKLLYEEFKLPERKGKKGEVTTNADALVSLIGFCKGEIASKKTEEAIQNWQIKLAVVRIVLQVRGYEKLISSYLTNDISADNRFRSVYHVSGTETSRWSASSWIDETGGNGQTFPRESLEIEDEPLLQLVK